MDGCVALLHIVEVVKRTGRGGEWPTGTNPAAPATWNWLGHEPLGEPQAQGRILKLNLYRKRRVQLAIFQCQVIAGTYPGVIPVGVNC